MLFTKRKLLGMIAQQFDPLGFITPFTISLKIMFQETWKAGYEWDTNSPHRNTGKHRKMDSRARHSKSLEDTKALDKPALDKNGLSRVSRLLLGER